MIVARWPSPCALALAAAASRRAPAWRCATSTPIVCAQFPPPYSHVLASSLPHTQRHCLRLSWPSRSATRRVKCRGSVPPLCKKLASRRALCAELAAGAGPCPRQPLSRREAWNKRVAGVAPLQGHHGSDTVVRACELARRPLISRSRLATDLPSLSLFSQRYRGWWFEFNFGRRRLSPCTRRRTIPRSAGCSSRDKAVRYALCLRASEFASTAQRFHERRRMAARRRVSVTIRTCCRLSRCCQLLRAARNARGCMGTRVFWAPSRDFLAQNIS